VPRPWEGYFIPGAMRLEPGATTGPVDATEACIPSSCVVTRSGACRVTYSFSARVHKRLNGILRFLANSCAASRTGTGIEFETFM